jgi:hypothetical protein
MGGRPISSSISLVKYMRKRETNQVVSLSSYFFFPDATRQSGSKEEGGNTEDKKS